DERAASKQPLESRVEDRSHLRNGREQRPESFLLGSEEARVRLEVAPHVDQPSHPDTRHDELRVEPADVLGDAWVVAGWPVARKTEEGLADPRRSFERCSEAAGRERQEEVLEELVPEPAVGSERRHADAAPAHIERVAPIAMKRAGLLDSYEAAP